MTCIMIVDRHMAFADGVRAWLGADFTILHARNLLEMDATLKQHQIALTLCEMRLGQEGHGLHLMQVLYERACRFLVCSDYPGIPLLRAAFLRGACGFFNKNDSLRKLKLAIDTALQGGCYFDAPLQQKVVEVPDTKLPHYLTPRERSLIALLYDRRLTTHPLLGQALHLAPGSCANILLHIYQKFHVHTREALLKKLSALEYYPEVDLQRVEYLATEYMY